MYVGRVGQVQTEESELNAQSVGTDSPATVKRAFVPGYTLRRTFSMSRSEKNGCKAISSKSGRDASLSSIIFAEERLVPPLCRVNSRMIHPFDQHSVVTT